MPCQVDDTSIAAALELVERAVADADELLLLLRVERDREIVITRCNTVRSRYAAQISSLSPSLSESLLPWLSLSLSLSLSNGVAGAQGDARVDARGALRAARRRAVERQPEAARRDFVAPCTPSLGLGLAPPPRSRRRHCNDSNNIENQPSSRASQVAISP